MDSCRIRRLTQTSKISFHSLRHTTTSLLKNAGVSSSIAEEFVGHDSTEMTHIEAKAMKVDADLLPDVLDRGWAAG